MMAADMEFTKRAVERLAGLRRKAGAQAATETAGPAGKRLVIGLVIGALTMLGVATLDAVSGAQVPVLGSLAALPVVAAGGELPERPRPLPTPGSCLDWKRADAADTAPVDCAAPHLFEQAGPAQVSDLAEIPDDKRWRQLVNERCTPVVVSYLSGHFDPDGKFRVGALKPSQKDWSDGDRTLSCGLQAASRSGMVFPIVGKVAEQDQADVHDPGTCLGIDGKAIGDPVDCAQPHAVESAGAVDLAPKFPSAFPAVADQDAYLQPTCTKLASDYAGGADVITKKKLTVYWDNLTAESWNAGTRKVGCNLAALLPDRSGFAPVTGSVRGPVTVGDTPAPPASASIVPGTPAPASSAPTEQPSSAQPPPSGPDQPVLGGPTIVVPAGGG